MKAFVIFPTICVFILILTLFKLNGQVKSRITLLWTIIVTSLFGGLMTWFSIDTFLFLYYGNFLGVFILIPCLTYLSYRLFLDKSEITFWRVLGLGFASTVLTLIIFGSAMFIALAYNPMDPGTRQEQKEYESD